MSYNNQFNVAGMSTSTSTHHSPNLNNWGSSSTSGPLSGSFGDSLSQSRSHYQSGYLMSGSPNNNAPQSNQRADEVPIVQTKAKMNQILSRGSQSDFGMESMFKSTRQRQQLADEDAPPMTSINDIPNEINYEPPSSSPFQSRKSTFEGPQYSTSQPRRHLQSPSVAQNVPLFYVIVFGYPPDKYSLTAEYFKSVGESTEPDQGVDIVNCFKIGYKDAGDAMRAVRKNGEVFGGSWMIGAKWADPAQVEALLGQQVTRSTLGASIPEPSSGANDMMVDSPIQSNSATPSVGTPIRLAPSTSAFRKGTVLPAKPATPQSQKGWSSNIPPASSSTQSAPASAQHAQSTPSKGVISQVSDLIFGW